MIGQTIRLYADRRRAHALVDQAPQGAILKLEMLHRLLRIDAETGDLFWKERPVELFNAKNPLAAQRRWNTRYAGRLTFTADDGLGYAKGALFNRTYKAHRVVFALIHGRWPQGEIDHIDGNPRNNRPSNLRECDRTGNVRNARAKRAGTKSSAFKGVTKRSSERFIVQCKGDDGRTYRGIYSTELEAARAYDEVAREMHGEFAKVNFE